MRTPRILLVLALSLASALLAACSGTGGLSSRTMGGPPGSSDATRPGIYGAPTGTVSPNGGPN